MSQVQLLSRNLIILNIFLFQIKFKCRPPIVDYISVDHKLESCICSASQTEVIRDCPQNIKIIIPSQNRQLWNCVRKILRKILDSKEYPFWSRILGDKKVINELFKHNISLSQTFIKFKRYLIPFKDTNLGARMIQWHMGDHNDSLAKELTHLFKTSVTYDVTTSDGINFLQTPHQLSIYGYYIKILQILRHDNFASSFFNMFFKI